MTFTEIKASKKSLGKRKKVLGVGVNDADYIVQPIIKGRRICCPFYKCWSDMLRRCYSEALHKKRPTYSGCSVCSEWLIFSNFKKWMISKNWQGNCLDKDLIEKGNKIYSPDTCLFVTPLVNGFLHENKKNRGDLMMGVSRHSFGRFQSSINYLGKQVYLGLFDTEIEAHKKYISKKLEAYEDLISRQSSHLVIRALNNHKQSLIESLPKQGINNVSR